MAINASSGDVTSLPRILPVSYCPVTITVDPEPGTTALVQFTTAPIKDINKGRVKWQPWPKGPVSVLTTDDYDAPITAFRVSRESGSGKVHWELNQ